MDGPTTRLRLRVTPGAGRSEVVGRHGEAWKVRVAAAPARGKANDAVLDLLARTLDIPRGTTEIVAGLRSRTKAVDIHGLSAHEIDRRLSEAGGTTRRARPRAGQASPLHAGEGHP